MAGICGGGNPAESEADRNLLRFRTIKLWVHRARVGEARQRTAMRRCDVPGPALTDRKVFRLAGQVRERNKHTGEPQTLFVCVRACSVVSDSATPWTVSCQAPLSMGFPRQEYWSGLPLPYSWGSSRRRDQTHTSCRLLCYWRILYH